jgi:DNA-binding NarL/FixJ family response regulator
MLNVAIAAVSAVVRAGLARIVELDPELVLAGIAETAGVLLGGDALPPDVVVIDTEDAQPPELEGETSELFPALVLLTDTPPGSWFAEVVDQRGGALLPRSASAEAIRAAIAAAGAGLVTVDRRAFSFSRGQGVQILPEADAEQLAESLTDRETEVLTLLADGHSNKAIARLLGVSEHTAKFHVSAILAKLGAITRAEAVAMGIRHGLISL